MRTSARKAVVGAVSGLWLAAAACGGDGGSAQTTAAPTTASATTSSGPAVEAHDDADELGAFRLVSPAFAAGTSIPARFTCDGEDVSPPLQWNAQPDGSQSLAIVVTDPDAPRQDGFVHWVLAGIDPPSGGVAEATDEHVAGTNDFGNRGWDGPCPPSGTHRYDFTIYAFDHATDFGGNPTRPAVEAEPGRLGAATLSATYSRGG